MSTSGYCQIHKTANKNYINDIGPKRFVNILNPQKVMVRVKGCVVDEKFQTTNLNIIDLSTHMCKEKDTLWENGYIENNNKKQYLVGLLLTLYIQDNDEEKQKSKEVSHIELLCERYYDGSYVYFCPLGQGFVSNTTSGTTSTNLRNMYPNIVNKNENMLDDSKDICKSGKPIYMFKNDERKYWTLIDYQPKEVHLEADSTDKSNTVKIEGYNAYTRQILNKYPSHDDNCQIKRFYPLKDLIRQVAFLVLPFTCEELVLSSSELSDFDWNTLMFKNGNKKTYIGLRNSRGDVEGDYVEITAKEDKEPENVPTEMRPLTFSPYNPEKPDEPEQPDQPDKPPAPEETWDPLRKWIRLIMPKNTRRVEVEDLNRNFWVISQAIAQISQYLFDDNSPLKKILPKILSELVQLNENVINLWAELYAIGMKYYDDIKVMLLPLSASPGYGDEQITKHYKEIRYDRFDYNGWSKGNWTNFFVSFKSRYSYLIHQYPKSNLIIIPFSRKNNYQHNYYSNLTFPGLILYDRNQEKFSYYKFLTENEDDISISIRSNSEVPPVEPATYILDQIYGFKELEDSYRLTKPFAMLETIEEETPQTYYGAIRFQPEVEAAYDDEGIRIDKFQLRFYDAGRQMLEPNIKPLLTIGLEDGQVVRSHSKLTDEELLLQDSLRQPTLLVEKPYNAQVEGEKVYLGEVVSWKKKTTEIEKFEIENYETYANTGVLIKIGNILPNFDTKGAGTNLENYGDKQVGGSERQKFRFKYNGKNYECVTGHQSHTLKTGSEFERTAYEVNIGLINSGNNLPGMPSTCYYSSSMTSYYYPTFDKTNNRWVLNQDPNGSSPMKNDMIRNGLVTIKDYLENDKTTIKEGTLKTNGNGESTFLSIDNDTNKVHHNVDLTKVTYFIGAFGIEPWDNTNQFYWRKNILFGIFVYIPNSLLDINSELRQEIVDNYFYIDVTGSNKQSDSSPANGNVSGVIFYRRDINKTESVIKDGDGSQRYFYTSADTWRLPKIFPNEQDVSALQVKSLKTNQIYYCKLSKAMKKEYEKIKDNKEGKAEYAKKIGDYKSNFLLENDFKTLITQNIIRSAAGVWTVFDGYSSREREQTESKPLNANSGTVLEILGKNLMDGTTGVTGSVPTNINRYNEANEQSSNENRQVCYMEYSIDANNELNCKNLLLRQRVAGPTHAWLPTRYDYENKPEELRDILDETKNIVLKPDVIGGDLNNSTLPNTMISDQVWKDSFVNYNSIAVSSDSYKVFTLDKPLKGIDISFANYTDDKYKVDWNSVDGSQIDFAIIRLGRGHLEQDNANSGISDNLNVFEHGKIDDYFDDNYGQCKAKKIKIGLYWFLYAGTAEEAREEAKCCVQIIKNKSLEFEYPVFLDYEWTNISSIEQDRKRNGVNVIRAFIDELTKEGYYVGLYSNENYLDGVSIDSTSQLSDLISSKRYWVASWKNPQQNLSNFNSFGMWQYSDGLPNSPADNDWNELSGFKAVDRNYCFVDYPKMVEAFKNNEPVFEEQLALIDIAEVAKNEDGKFVR